MNTKTDFHLTGIIVGGGWEHDAFGNPCALIEIALDSHHIMLIDDAENGWTLSGFDDSPNPHETFHQAIGMEFGENAEFDYDVLSAYVGALEQEGSARVMEVCQGKTIALRFEPNARMNNCIER